MALPWYVLAAHGGVLLLGTVLAAYGVPRTALIAVGGYASDRWRPQTVMMATDAVRALALAALAVTAATGPARAVVLVPIAVVIGAGRGALPARVLLDHPLAAVRRRSPGRATRWRRAGRSWRRWPARPSAARWSSWPAPRSRSGSTRLSFVVSAVTLAALSGPAVPASVGGDPARPPGNASRGTGARRCARCFAPSACCQIILLVNVAANLGLGGESEVALPALVHGPLHAGASGYGAVLAAFGGGALLGTIAAGQLGRLRRPVIVGSLAFLAEAACIAVAPYLGATVAVAAAMAGLGIMNGFGNVLTITAFQRWAPPSALGRLAGLLTLTSFGVFPISVALAALVVRHWGPRPSSCSRRSPWPSPSWPDSASAPGATSAQTTRRQRRNPQSTWKDNPYEPAC